MNIAARNRLTLLISAVAVIAVWVSGSALFAPFTSIPWEADKRLFNIRCAQCHQVESVGVTMYGPNLATIGASAGSRIPGRSAAEYLLESIVQPSAYKLPGEPGVMPSSAAAGLSRQEIASIAAYLMTLGGTPEYAALARLVRRLDPPAAKTTSLPSFAAAEAGKRLFVENCMKCHSLKQVPGSNLRAPSAFSLKAHELDHLLKSIRSPSLQILRVTSIGTCGLLPANSIPDGLSGKRPRPSNCSWTHLKVNSISKPYGYGTWKRIKTAIR
jgi:mono/diheme cytochrome c family protein